MQNNYEEEISLLELIEVLLKRKKLIAITTLVFMIGSLVFAFSPLNEKELEFDAVSSIAIVFQYRTPENPEEIGEGFVMYQDRMSGTMIPTIRAYAQSLTLLRGIIAELDLRDDEGELLRARKLAEDIKIENQSGSNLITITVKYNDEELTAAIANLIPKRLIEMAEANENLRDFDIMIIDEAIASEIEQSGGRALVLAIGTVLGVMLGIFLGFALEYLDKTVRNKKDILGQGIDVDLEGKDINSPSFANHLVNHIYLLDREKYHLSVEKENISKGSLEALISNISKSGEDLNILDFTGTLKGLSTGKLNIKDMSDSNNEYINVKNIKNAFENKGDSKILAISFSDLELFEVLSKLSDSTLISISKEKTERKKIEEISHIKEKYNCDIRGILI